MTLRSEEDCSQGHKSTARRVQIGYQGVSFGHIPIHELGSANTSHRVYRANDDGTINVLNTFQFDLGSGLTLSPQSTNGTTGRAKSSL